MVKKFFKKQKQKFVNWLLKETDLGFTFFNNKITNCNFEKEISIQTIGNIYLNKVMLPDDVEIVIRKKRLDK